LPGDELLVIEYLDARGADGNARKYRVMMIGGKLFPLHLAISRDWKVHYFTSDMADQSDHRAEELAFLADMPSVIGEKAFAALHAICKALGLDYAGFVEGDDIAKGSVDVIVTDGFTGNVALKTAEGLARFFVAQLRQTFTESAISKAGGFIARGALRRMGARLDPSGINGGPFLGLNGVVVKSHGGADAAGFANAIRLAVSLAQSDFVAEIDSDLRRAAADDEPARKRTVA